MRVKIDSQKRIVLPSKVMEYLDLKPGDTIEFLPDWEPEVVLVRAVKGANQVCDNLK